MGLIVTSIGFLFTALLDIVIAAFVLRRRDKRTAPLGYALIAGAFISIFYTGSILARNYFSMSLCSSFYFISVDLALLALIFFLTNFCETHKTKLLGNIRWIATAYFLVDAIGLVLNPFLAEFAISYFPIDASVGLYAYQIHLFYRIHLIYCYLMVAYCIGLLIYGIIKSPSLYKTRHALMLFGLSAIVLLNAIYLFLPSSKIYDYSILFYSLLGLLIYILHFHVTNRLIINQARSAVIDQLGHGIIVFDHQDCFVTQNSYTEFLISPDHRNDRYTLSTFIKNWGFTKEVGKGDQEVSFLWSPTINEEKVSYRVDYHLLTDKKGRIIGKLFVIMDNSLEVDILTGFPTWLGGMHALKKLDTPLSLPCAVCACDIERLSAINEQFDRGTGDDALALLAHVMRAVFPRNSKFMRQPDGTLLAIAPSTSEHDGRQYLEKVKHRMDSQSSCKATIRVHTCVEMVRSPQEPIADTIHRVMGGLRSYKLLEEESSHASLISSLVQMQRQGDGETEDHVQRTRLSGELLGKRLGLSDRELNELALLCLLHDIGKVGVPLEILNKPGRLTEAEWTVMRSHTTKGYTIAKSSEELSDIAEYILHHHENWDGSGYPDGLSGEAIPLLSRMVAVVDTFDAMTHDRPYRRAISLEQAKEELRKHAGTQFDPTIAAEFLAVLEEHPEIAVSEWSPSGSTSESSSILPPQSSNKPARATVLDQNGDLITREYARYHLDENGRIFDINEEFTRLTGYDQQDLDTYQLTQNDLIPLDDQKTYWGYVVPTLQRDHAAMMEHRIIAKNGLISYVICYGREYYDPVNKKSYSEIIAADLQQTRLSKKLLSDAAVRNERAQQRWEDALRKDVTGVLTRSAFQNDAQLVLMDENSILLLMIMDVDNFKQYNDTKGHPAGDALLQRMAQLLLDASADNGFAGRLGGDEFAIARRFSRNISKEALEASVASTWEQINNGLMAYDNVHISLGASCLAAPGGTFSSLYAVTDDALYEAKEGGRNRYCAHLNK